MEYQAQNEWMGLSGRAEVRAARTQWRFIDIYHAILNAPNLSEAELVVLSRLVSRRITACRQQPHNVFPKDA